MRIVQSEKYQGGDWWSWSVWIDGKADELRAVDSVTYSLHPTFANPVRKVTDKRSKFRLTENGWGGFTIYARVDLKTGKKRNLKHDLVLYYPEGQEADSVTIRINGQKKGDPKAEPLQSAIKDAAPDASVERDKAAATSDAIGTILNVLLTGPTLYSVAKGIQGWLARNPQASIDLLQNGQVMASRVTGSNILKTLNSLKS
jgi:transcription initiation factor TFIID/TFIIF subunit